MLPIISVLEHILAQMGIRSEVYGGERDITQQAGSSTLVQTKDAKLANDVHGSFGDSTVHLGSLTLYLETNFPREKKAPVSGAKSDIYEKPYTISKGFVKTCRTINFRLAIEITNLHTT